MLFQIDDKTKLEEIQKELEVKEQVTEMAAQLGKALLDKNSELESEIQLLRTKVYC